MIDQKLDTVLDMTVTKTKLHELRQIFDVTV